MASHQYQEKKINTHAIASTKFISKYLQNAHLSVSYCVANFSMCTLTASLLTFSSPLLSKLNTYWAHTNLFEECSFSFFTQYSLSLSEYKCLDSYMSNKYDQMLSLLRFWSSMPYTKSSS